MGGKNQTMNSNLLYEGEYYAWYMNRPKGRTPIGAAKVRVNRVRKSKSIYDKNRKTVVDITIIEPNNMQWYKAGSTRTVPAREIVDSWDSYKDEEALLILEIDRRNLEYRRSTIRSSVLQTYIAQGLLEKGLGDAHVSIASERIHFRTNDILDWLGISEEEIDAAVEKALGPEVANNDEPDFLRLINGG